MPKMVQEALKLLNQDTREIPGPSSNPIILQMAREAGVQDIYRNDDDAWCALAQSAIAIRAGKQLPFFGFARLRANSFKQFGSHIDTPMLGDTLVFKRPGGFHVGLYIGEDIECFHVSGGNQGNQYSIKRFSRSRLEEARRPAYNQMPSSVRRRWLSQEGEISINES